MEQFLLTKREKCIYNDTTSGMKSMKKICIAFNVFLVVFILNMPSNSCSGEIEVKRDKDKTSYSIGSSQEHKDGATEEEKDKEKAWDMLRNSNIIIDKRNK